MNKVYISLGTNLGYKKQNLSQAINLIEKRCGKIVQMSSIFSTKAWGFDSFNNFLNQIILLKTAFTAQELIAQLLRIEVEMGRRRTELETYQDRIIDIDIIFYNKEVVSSENLTIPHPKMHERNFILAPMAEIAPEFKHPILQKSIEYLLKNNIDQDIAEKL